MNYPSTTASSFTSSSGTSGQHPRPPSRDVIYGFITIGETFPPSRTESVFAKANSNLQAPFFKQFLQIHIMDSYTEPPSPTRAMLSKNLTKEKRGQIILFPWIDWEMHSCIIHPPTSTTTPSTPPPPPLAPCKVREIIWNRHSFIWGKRKLNQFIPSSSSSCPFPFCDGRLRWTNKTWNRVVVLAVLHTILEQCVHDPVPGM